MSFKRRLVLVIAAILASLAVLERVVPYDFAANEYQRPAPPPADARGAQSDAILQRAYEQRLGDLQVQGEGVVVRVLSDDLKGSRHQRFILQLDSGQTLLVAHNIDLAPRINALSLGDRVQFYGEYEWNEEGGVIHWTHHDPGGRHVDGWLKYNGQTYQ